MKKISLLLVVASLSLAISSSYAQTPDTTKNKVEIKKKTKVGVNGRRVTKIKMESKGTAEAMNGAVDAAVTGTPSKKATPASNPTVVVVNPEPVTKVVSTPVAAAVRTPVTTTHTTTTTANVRHVTTTTPVKRKTTTYVKKPVSASSTTTTTTTVKKD